MRQAIDNVLNRWTAGTVFLNYGEVELSNSWVENTIRPSSVGKRNWLFIGDLEGGHRCAIIYSLTQPVEFLRSIPTSISKTYLPGYPEHATTT